MDKEFPFFSVIIPVFNRADRISQAVQSVFNQTYGDWELVIVDDCSDDATASVIQTFLDARVRYFRNGTNQGPAISRNIGIKNSRGKVISFLDSDDRYFPEFLAQTKYAFDSRGAEAGFCWTGLKVQYNSGTKTEIWDPVIKISSYYTFLKELRIGTNSGLSVRRLVFEECGFFNENLSAAEDTEFLLRIVQQYDFLVVKEVLIFIDKSGRDRLSLNYYKNAFSYNQFIGQHWNMIHRHKELMGKFYYKMMWLNYHIGDYQMARGYMKGFMANVGFSAKLILIFLIFEVFGSKLGSRFHIFFSH